MCRDRKGGFGLIISCFLTNGAISAIDNIFQSLEEFCTETETSHSLLLQCSVGLFSFGGENVVLKDPLPSVGSTSHFKKFTSCTLNYFVRLSSTWNEDKQVELRIPVTFWLFIY